VPTEPITPVELVPALGRLADAVAADAAEQVRREGKEITCRAGCGACCRQIVPIAPIEARYLAELVGVLPSECRAEINERVGKIRGVLIRERLLEPLWRLDRLSRREKRTFALAYFRLGLACPFLMGERCSIYDDRPLSCREYLVTSPPQHCLRAGEGRVALIPLPVSLAHRIGAAGENRPVRIPLVLAFEWVAQNPERQDSRCSGPALLAELLRATSV